MEDRKSVSPDGGAIHEEAPGSPMPSGHANLAPEILEGRKDTHLLGAGGEAQAPRGSKIKCKKISSNGKRGPSPGQKWVLQNIEVPLFLSPGPEELDLGTPGGQVCPLPSDGGLPAGRALSPLRLLVFSSSD